ncbi:MAG: hypothetical protein ACI9QL_001814 [Candidatus Omnitrophota bacterium]|jgi:hypothetical protein
MNMKYLIFCLTLSLHLATAATTVLVEENSAMRYLANETDPAIGLTWTAAVFDDSTWPTGLYGVGYETGTGGAASLVQTPVSSATFSVYTRAGFTITDTANVTNLLIGADYCDGYVAWINGVEVYRSPEMPAGAPNWNTDSSSHESSNGAGPDYGVLVDITLVGKPALTNGANVLSIGIWNRGAPTSSDLVLLPRLSINEPVIVPATVLVEQHAAMTYLANQTASGVDATWMAETFDDSSWTAGTYGIGYDNGGSASALNQTTVPNDVFSVFTRSVFSIVDLSTVTNLFIGADYDDGYAAWINGVEVFRSGEMPAGALAWNADASSHESSNATVPAYGLLADITTNALPALQVGNNVLAVGVWNNGAPTSSDMVLVPRLSMNEPTAVSRGPYLHMNHETGITIRWRTITATDSQVNYGDAPGNLIQSVSSAALATEHEVVLTGLTTATTYFYSIGSSTEVLAGDDPDHFFKTAPSVGTSTPTRIWLLGDAGTGNSSARAVRNAYLGLNDGVFTDLLIMLGDNAYDDGTDAQYQLAFFDMYPTVLRQTPVWSTMGNHDGRSADSATQTGPYYENYTFPTAGEIGGMPSGTEAYYSFEYANIHFICLDAYETDRSVGGAMHTWMEQDLMNVTNEWLIAFWHHPPYTKGTHNSDTEGRLIDMRENFVPMLEAHGVDLVLSGHSHAYERSYFLNGHYGHSSTFNAGSMVLDGGDGQVAGNGAYTRSKFDIGTVYTVTGSAGKIGNDFGLNHPVMFYSEERLGSFILDVDGLTLNARFLDSTGVVRDTFTIEKNLTPADRPDAISRSPITGFRILASSVVTNDIPQNGGELTVIQVNAPSSGEASAYMLGPYIVYQPNPGFYGSDTFTYVVMEAGGLTSTGTITVNTVTPAGLSSNITGLNPQPGPVIQVSGAGVPGRSFLIECSTDGGASWIPLGTSIADGVGQFLYNHASAPPSAIYRAMFDTTP